FVTPRTTQGTRHRSVMSYVWKRIWENNKMLQGGRIRLKGWQQTAVAVGSVFGALMDPSRADLIAALGETTGKPAFERVLERMKNNPEGRASFLTLCGDSLFHVGFNGRILGALSERLSLNDTVVGLDFQKTLNDGRPLYYLVSFTGPRYLFLRLLLLERPRVISPNVGHAWDLPENTFGAAYARFMGSRNFSPDDRPPVRFMETGELAYIAMRAREVHDFWHTLFALPTNLIGESALKVIEFEQMYLPMCLLSVVGGTARFNEKQRALSFKHYLPWATRAGMQCTDLMCIYYEQHFHEDLAVVRKR
ncbi:hypothetical protein MKW98_028689, partial [Papaver atlanticum]